MHSTRWAASLVVALGLGMTVGCGVSTPEDETSTSRSSSLEQVEGVEAPLEDDESETMRPAETVREIDWEATESMAVISSAEISEQLETFYEGAPVPVLLPDDRRTLRTVEPTVGEHWYAAAFDYRGREVTIEGDRVVRQAESLPSPAAGGDTRFRVSQTHGVLTVSFTRFGAAYTLDVECEEVSRRGTCTNQSFATDLADNLARVGGVR